MGASEPPTRFRMLALGDSYTAGEGVPSSERWPEQLRRLLAEACGALATVECHYIAQTGWTTDELATAIRDRGPAGPYALVSLLIGVNNQYRGRLLEEYRKSFRELLATAVALAAGDPRHVVVLSIPDWGVTPFAGDSDREQIAREIDAFNGANRDAADAAGTRYVEVTAISRRARAEADLVASDGLHPSGRMYRLWAEAVLPHANAALKG